MAEIYNEDMITKTLKYFYRKELKSNFLPGLSCEDFADFMLIASTPNKCDKIIDKKQSTTFSLG